MDTRELHNQNLQERQDDETVFVAEVTDDPTADESKPPRARWSNIVTILVACVLVLGPVAYLGLPDEIARWYVAAALEAQDDGDANRAIEHMGMASRWAPNDASISTYRAILQQQKGDYEGSLIECNKALAIDPTNDGALIQRSQVLQHLGRHDEAISDWKKLTSSPAMSRIASRVMYLNGLAYAQALGNTELDAALENVENAIKTVGQNSAMLDTRGFIQYRRGDLKSARSDLELAVKMAEDEYSQAAGARQDSPPSEFDQSLQQLAQSVAVIRYHRSLIFDALNKPEAAEKDRARVRELGFEPGDHLF